MVLLSSIRVEGKEGQPSVNVKIQSGILTPTKLPQMANSATWANMYNIARTSRGAAPLYTAEEMKNTERNPILIYTHL